LIGGDSNRLSTEGIRLKIKFLLSFANIAH
jgi:hypothetical protein